MTDLGIAMFAVGVLVIVAVVAAIMVEGDNDLRP
jgi:hypothetical protein